jgi:hypothetical protein
MKDPSTALGSTSRPATGVIDKPVRRPVGAVPVVYAENVEAGLVQRGIEVEHAQKRPPLLDRRQYRIILSPEGLLDQHVIAQQATPLPLHDGLADL